MYIQHDQVVGPASPSPFEMERGLGGEATPTPPTTEALEARVQARWFAMIQAEDAGAESAELERLFAAYLRDVEALAEQRLAQVAMPTIKPRRARVNRSAISPLSLYA